MKRHDQSLEDLKEKLKTYKSKLIEVKPVKPQIALSENPLSILQKFQAMHKYNVYNSRKKLESGFKADQAAA